MMMKKMKWGWLGFLGLAMLVACSQKECKVKKGQRTGLYSVIDFGAIGDGITLNTVAIQDAIDAATLAEGAARSSCRRGSTCLEQFS